MRTRHRMMATVGLTALASVLGWAIAAAAQTNGIQQLELSLTDEEVVIRLASERRLERPRVSYRRGTIKMWFPRVPEDRRLEVEGDGEAIRRVRVRPGANGTALLKVELGDKRRLDPGTAQVDAYPTGAVVRIPRSALPKPAVPKRETPAAPEADEQPGARAPAGAAESETAAGGADKAPLFAVKGEEAQVTGEGAEGAIESDINAASNSEKKPTALATRTLAASDQVPTFVTMAIASVVLGLVLVAVRMWNGKRPARLSLPNIEVIGTKRLGARHQLVLVRALGEDHLLSMNGDKTERIASAPSPGTQADAIKLLPPATPHSASLSLPVGGAEAANGDAPSSAATASPLGKETPFGAELLNFMARRSHPAWRPKSNAQPRGNSPAVEGLLRLREREAS